MEAVQQAVLQAGLDEAEFWASTPYQTVLRIKAAQRAKLEGFLMVGWMSERFAREDRLQGPQHYIRTMLDQREPEDEDDGDAFVAMFALSNGLGVDEVEPDPDAA